MRTPMESLLIRRLDGCARVAVLGVGSELRGDDAAGVLVVRELNRRVAEAPFARLEFEGVEGSNAPENVTGFIASFRPTHVVVVDAADIGALPGEWREVGQDEIDGTDFSTHTLPLPVVIDYLRQATGAVIVLLGMQPGRMDFGSAPTRKIKDGVRSLSGSLFDALKDFDEGLDKRF